jgi:P4 family phage/plasmid primase-like protien
MADRIYATADHLIAAAFALHARGFHVFPADHPDHPECIGKHSPQFPCDGQRGKHPAVKWGVWAVTVTPQMIEREWGKHGGLANIAVSCGPSGLVVLDEDAPDEIERWCVTYGVTLPDTYTVTTGRGRHLYFRWDHSTARIGNVPKAVDGFEMDVRGHGGVAIAEGSQHATGVVYTGNGQPVVELPEQVGRILLAGAPTNGQPHEAAGQFREHHDGRDYDKDKIGFHARHHGLVAYAGRLRKSGLSLAEALPAFQQRWLLCEQPEGQIREAKFHSTDCPYPVTWTEAEAKLRDVFERYSAGQNLNSDRAQDAPQPAQASAGRYFNKAGLRAATLLRDCEQLGPLASGIDGKVWAYTGGVWVHGDRELRARAVKLLGERYRRAHADTVESMVLSRVPFINDTPATEYLNVENGLLHWRTGRLRDHTAKVPSTTRIPVRWNPDAQCPNIDTFLNAVVAEECVPVLEEVAGYALYPSQPLHKAVMLDGNGRNGKGKFLQILAALLGRPNIAAVPPQRLDTDKWAVAQLYGKLANLVGDVNPSTFKETATFKQATGQDLLYGEHKYCAGFTFTSRALIVAAFNSLPRSVDTTEGFFSRWLVIPFPNRFADPDEHGQIPAGCYQRDPDLEAKILATTELEGFLVRAVEGLQRVIGRGQFTHAEAIADAEREFRRHADPVRGFLAEQVIADRDAWISRASLHAAFKEWATESGLGALSARRFTQKVREVHVEIFGYAHVEAIRQGDRGWSGLRLRLSEDEPDQGAPGAQGAFPPIVPPLRAGDKGRDGAPSAPCAPGGDQSANGEATPRRAGCVCRAQPHPCHWCELAANKQGGPQ